MARSRIAFLIAVALFLVGLALMVLITDEQYLLLSVALLVVSMLPFFIRFEIRQIQTREIVFIAILAAIAAVSRVPFAPLPNVQPTSFFIIIAGIACGGEIGFMIGAIAALVSNLFLGQGPWTPWQMFAWGMLGWTAGLFSPRGILPNRWLLIAFGFIWGFLFGWIMNLWTAAGLLSQGSWTGIAAVYAASLYFDLAHALSNAFFLIFFSNPWFNILRRFQCTYGLFTPNNERKAV